MLDVWEMRMNKDNIFKRYVKLFNFWKDANIVVYFHKKLQMLYGKIGFI